MHINNHIRPPHTHHAWTIHTTSKANQRTARCDWPLIIPSLIFARIQCSHTFTNRVKNCCTLCITPAYCEQCTAWRNSNNMDNYCQQRVCRAKFFKKIFFNGRVSAKISPYLCIAPPLDKSQYQGCRDRSEIQFFNLSP